MFQSVFRIVATTLVAAFLVNDGFSQSITIYEKQVKETIQRVETFHVRVAQINKRVSKGVLTKQKQDLYRDLASQMTVPPTYKHLPFPESRSTKPWSVKAEKVATGLKPNINYQVVRGRNDSVICGSEAAIDNLYHNVRIIAWYLEQLDQRFSSETEDVGAVALAGLLEEYLSVLSDALPDVKIRKTGRMNVAGDQKLKYSESKLWRIMSVINRYFFYKIQVHSDRKDFYAADFLLMNSLIRTAALYGARPPQGTLTNIDFRLKATDQGWKQYAFTAIDSWEKEIDGDFDNIQNLCAIAIPPKAKPKPKKPAPPKPKPPANGFPPNVEDVKEVGGQIFLKIDGKWKPWNKK